MNKSKMPISEFLYLSGLRINNSITDEAIANAVAQFGYTPEKLAVGKQLLDSAIFSCEKFDKEHGDVEAAFEKRNSEKQRCETAYQQLHTIAGVALKKDTSAQVTLGLSGKTPRTFGAWTKKVRTFYNNLKSNPEWMTAIAEYGITPEKVDAGLTLLVNLEKSAEAIMQEKGDAQNATVERDIKLEALNEWVSDYEKIAEISLTDQPQLLEKLGIVVKR